MKMKAKIQILIVFVLACLVLIPILQGCKKYEDGPMFSFRSRAERVANTWKIENYKVNGSDLTSLVATYNETFTKGGSYSYDWSVLNGSGTWKFQNNDKEIKLDGTDDHSSRTLTILKLEEGSFWYSWMDGNDKYEVHLVTK